MDIVIARASCSNRKIRQISDVIGLVKGEYWMLVIWTLETTEIEMEIAICLARGNGAR